VTAETPAVLADIDAALEDWEDGEDAAAWYADGGPDDLAEETGMQGYHPTLVIIDEIADWDRAAAGVLAMYETFAAAMRKCGDAILEFARAMHPIAAALDPKSHRRCRLCFPHANPAPLAIDGHAYHRRQKARRRRKR
jgi:hypothetical protein